jgi:multiple sugar transport system substrate-binding protein
MGQEELRVLAVEDPAVIWYADKGLGILNDCQQNVVFDIVPWADYYSKMMEVFAGRAEYDIVMVAGHLWLRDFAKKGYLSEIEFEEEDILPVITREMKYQNKPYLSPSFFDGHMIVYRKRLLYQILGRELGPIITPLEYLESARALKIAEGKSQVAMKAHKSEIFTDALPFLRMYGGEVYGEDGRSVCDSEKVIAGLESYLELKKFSLSGTENFGNKEISAVIREKRAAMAVTWSGQLGEVMKNGCAEPEDLGFSTFTTACNVTWSFAVSSGCMQKRAANAFLRYLRSSSVDGLIGRKSGAPLRVSSYQKGTADCPWYPVQMHMMNVAKPLPSIHKCGDKNAVLYEYINEAFAGKITARQALEAARREIDSIV